MKKIQGKQMKAKKRLSAEERQRIEDLLTEANEQGETYVAQIAKLALQLSDEGRYDDFRKVFSNND